MVKIFSENFYKSLFYCSGSRYAFAIGYPDQSDSAYLDNMVEMLVHAGRSLPHVMMMLIPEAWDGNEIMEDYKNISMSSMPV